MKTILVTGGCGFIGTNFIRYALKRQKNIQIVNLDKLTYAGNLANLSDLEGHSRYKFVKGDICSRKLLAELAKEHKFDGVINFAAESHVDRSIMGARSFVKTNVMGTLELLEMARAADVPRFLQISTDEVYGSLGPTGLFRETTPLDPNSPYSSSKASADLIALSYFRTHGYPTLVTRCSNNYGPYQFPEKLIPLMTLNAMRDLPLPVYGDGKNVRDWIYVEDHCAAIDLVFRNGRPGEVYNVGADSEMHNIDIVKIVLRILNKPATLIKYVTDRPGHDRRYAIDSKKIREELGWKPQHKFIKSLEKTVKWYVNNEEWWRDILAGGYRSYYKRQYQNR